MYTAISLLNVIAAKSHTIATARNAMMAAIEFLRLSAASQPPSPVHDIPGERQEE
jgi:hypothetical protein